jgi:4a-hydroxytetrahydrobiopterin dehydratase
MNLSGMWRKNEVKFKLKHFSIFSAVSIWDNRFVRNLMNTRCDLSKKKCAPCQGGVPPLKGESLAQLHRQLEKGWKIVDSHHLEKEYAFKNFREALAFTNAIGAIAEEEGHHPDIFLAYGKVKIELWTHKIDGLTESDFILAAKIDKQLH